MNRVIDKIVLKNYQIEKRVKELAAQISQDYENMTPEFVGILKGACMFTSDLVRNIDVNCTLNFAIVQSCHRNNKRSKIKLIKDCTNIKNKDIIIVDDLVDSGITLDYLIKRFTKEGAKSIKTCVLLNKSKRRQVQVQLDYVGFDIESDYIVGYGLDCDDLYRNYPHIAKMTE